MKRVLSWVVMFVGMNAVAQRPPAPGGPSAPSPTRQARVFVTDSDSWQMQGGSGGSLGGFGGGFGGAFGSGVSGGARPQTAEIIKTLSQRCPQLIVNNRPEASDYVLRLEHEGGKGLLRHKDKVAVFVRKSGDSIYSDSTLSVGGAVQGACAAVDKHWAANTAALTEPELLPAIAASSVIAVAPALASLEIEASAPGADIEVDGEFMGNTPSTLSVTPGKHTVTVKKKGYANWSRTLNVSGSSVHLNAELSLAES